MGSSTHNQTRPLFLQMHPMIPMSPMIPMNPMIPMIRMLRQGCEAVNHDAPKLACYTPSMVKIAILGGSGYGNLDNYFPGGGVKGHFKTLGKESSSNAALVEAVVGILKQI